MRFRKSINIMKGVRLNFSKSGVSLTVGGKGISANLGGKGLFLNTSIAKPRLSHVYSPARRMKSPVPARRNRPRSACPTRCSWRWTRTERSACSI